LPFHTASSLGPPPKIKEGKKSTAILMILCVCICVGGCTALPFVLIGRSVGWTTAISFDALRSHGPSDTVVYTPTPQEHEALRRALPHLQITALVLNRP
jgi:hypothetical protein